MCLPLTILPCSSLVLGGGGGPLIKTQTVNCWRISCLSKNLQSVSRRAEKDVCSPRRCGVLARWSHEDLVDCLFSASVANPRDCYAGASVSQIDMMTWHVACLGSLGLLVN